jgi:hypothetical protein
VGSDVLVVLVVLVLLLLLVAALVTEVLISLAKEVALLGDRGEDDPMLAVVEAGARCGECTSVADGFLAAFLIRLPFPLDPRWRFEFGFESKSLGAELILPASLVGREVIDVMCGGNAPIISANPARVD